MQVVCMKHISAEEGGSTTYRSRSVEALGLRKQNQDKHVELNTEPDQESSFVPPDKAINYNSRKQKSSTSSLLLNQRKAALK